MIMKRTLIIIGVLLTFFNLSITAQQDTIKSNWKFSGITALNISQISFSNWAAGGDNSINGNTFAKISANYKKNKSIWDNNLDLGYGLMKQGKKENSKFFKTDDRIEFASKYGKFAFDHWYYTALISFKTQFTEGYKSINDTIKISDFMSPGYFNISIGMDYKPLDKLTVLISPVSGKLTFVKDSILSYAGAFGVKPGENVRKEFGGFIKIQYKTDFFKNISYSTKLELFSNYLYKPQNIDVNWDNLLTLKINSLFTASFQYTLLYDDDIKIKYDSNGDNIPDSEGARLQSRQIFGIGLSYKF